MVGHGSFGDEVVDVVGPVLDRCIATASTAFDNDFNDRRVKAFGAVHRRRASFDVVNLSSLVDDDQRSFKLPHVFRVNAEVGLEWEVDRDTLRDVDEGST